MNNWDRVARVKQREYQTFLKSKFWKDMSAEKRRLVPYCEACKRDNDLEAHHIKYPKDWYDTTLEMLEVLCGRCHKMEHNQIYANECFTQKLSDMNNDLDVYIIPTSLDEKELVRLLILASGIANVDRVKRLFLKTARMRMAGPKWKSWMRKSKKIRDRLYEFGRKKLDRILMESKKSVSEPDYSLKKATKREDILKLNGLDPKEVAGRDMSVSPKVVADLSSTSGFSVIKHERHQPVVEEYVPF